MNREEKIIRKGVQALFGFTQAVLLFKLIGTQDSLGLVVGICIVAFLLILTSGSNMEHLKTISIGMHGVKAELERFQKEIDKNKQELYNLISLSMGENTFANLKQLAREGGYGEYEIERHMGLETELYYLRNLGLVELIPNSAHSIHEIPVSGDQLSNYIRLTNAGLRYIELRNSVDPKA